MDKRDDLVTTLVHSTGPLSGEVLGARLGVSSRTVRNYVRALNRHGTLIRATHHGYQIDRDLHRQSAVSVQTAAASPASRHQFLCRFLARSSETTGVHALAETLCVSESTLDADLSRVRGTLGRHGLVLRRDRECIWADGEEGARRSMLAEIIRGPSGECMASALRELCSEYPEYDLAGCMAQVSARAEQAGLSLNEYALADVVIEVVVTVDRVRSGHVLPESADRPAPTDERVLSLAVSIADLTAERFDVVLAPSELDALCSMLTTRAVLNPSPDAAEGVDPTMHALVREVMDELAGQYHLGPADEGPLLDLTLHVQNLAARVGPSTGTLRPLGERFAAEHPLVHELSLRFSQKLESRLGIRVDSAGLDYLSFHLGAQYLQWVENVNVVTVTLVTPRYYGFAERLAAQVTDLLKGHAVVEHIATTLEFDWTTVTSDLIVTTIDSVGPAAAPVVDISPFLTTRDAERLLAALLRIRERNGGLRLGDALTTLLDRRTFLRVDRVESREAAIAAMCASLAAAGYVDSSFCEQVLARERRSSTQFGGEFALPHAWDATALKSGIAVLVAESGIPWGPSRVRVAFLVALSPDDRASLPDLLEELPRTLSSRASVAALVSECVDFDSFSAALTDLLRSSRDQDGC